MAITNGYLTLTEIRGWVGAPSTHTEDDVRLEEAVTAASRYIDDLCGRRFYANTVDETRYYTATREDRLTGRDGLDDIYAITTLKTDDDEDRTYETTWATTDYDLLPFNAALDGEPYARIETSPDGDYSFPTHAKGVQIVGKFGWSTCPAVVKRACYILTAYLFKQKDAPLGVQGGGDMGNIYVEPRVNAMMRQMLDGVRKTAIQDD